MTGGVDASSLAQGLRIKASRADALVATVKNHSIFRSVHASGQVVLVKTAETPTSKRSTTLNCSVANFERGTDVSTVTGIGQVRIVDMDSNKHQVLVATGSRCTAKLTSQEKTKGDPLRSAVLEGPVTVQVDQAPEKPNAKPGTVTATSDRLEYANAGSTATITLLGNVRMKGGNGLFSGTSGPMPQLRINLDDKGQMVGASGGSS
jgi:hypothetical protein